MYLLNSHFTKKFIIALLVVQTVYINIYHYKDNLCLNSCFLLKDYHISISSITHKNEYTVKLSLTYIQKSPNRIVAKNKYFYIYFKCTFKPFNLKFL